MSPKGPGQRLVFKSSAVGIRAGKPQDVRSTMRIVQTECALGAAEGPAGQAPSLKTKPAGKQGGWAVVMWEGSGPWKGERPAALQRVRNGTHLRK